jgi:hypothetical protein
MHSPSRGGSNRDGSGERPIAWLDRRRIRFGELATTPMIDVLGFSVLDANAVPKLRSASWEPKREGKRVLGSLLNRRVKSATLFEPRGCVKTTPEDPKLCKCRTEGYGRRGVYEQEGSRHVLTSS